jgi:5'-nucleotidase
MKFKFLNLQSIKNKSLNKLFTYLLITTTCLIIACSTNPKYVSKNSSISVDSTYTADMQVSKLISPYKSKLDAEMNEVLVISSQEFPREKGKPQTLLGNLVADLSLEIAKNMYTDSIDFCLLNFGGLRTSLPKGEITRGKIFELMPFENELVVLTINKDSLNSLISYLVINGGQPVSGNFKLSTIETKDLDDALNPLPISSEAMKNSNQVNVLTSDYLANGGDNMTFFSNPIKYEKVGIKLRDAIIKYCIDENKKGNTLTSKIDGRIVFE